MTKKCSYCGGVPGEGIITLTNAEMRTFVAMNSVPACPKCNLPMLIVSGRHVKPKMLPKKKR